MNLLTIITVPSIKHDDQGSDLHTSQAVTQLKLSKPL